VTARKGTKNMSIINEKKLHQQILATSQERDCRKSFRGKTWTRVSRQTVLDMKRLLEGVAKQEIENRIARMRKIGKTVKFD
tara:strand:- start:35 stop:277 length:243 start_codon:yes stop_codon:yes gene_type:complete